MESIEIELLEWVNKESKKMGSLSFNTIEPLRLEASKRRYYRLKNKNLSLIVNTLDPSEDDNLRFIEIGSFLIKNGVSVPEVISFNEEKNFLLQEDFGDDVYQFILKDSNYDQLFTAAIDEILLIQNSDHQGANFPVFNKQRAFKEMDLFGSWFFKDLLGLTEDPKLLKLFSDTYNKIWINLEKQPKTLCHFDFETRNLMMLKDSAGVIDFQDILIGPVALDLVSLLKDLYFPLSSEQTRKFIALYLKQAIDLGILDRVELEEFIIWFEWTGVQRQLRIMGTLSRLYLRDGNASRLLDLEIILEYLITSCETLNEMDSFLELLLESKPKLLTFLEHFK